MKGQGGAEVCGRSSYVTRKRLGNALVSTRAHWCAPLSREKVPIWPYKDPARERIQTLRGTAQIFARATNPRNPHCTSLRLTSHMTRVQTSSGVGGPAASTRLCSVVEGRSVGDIRAIESVEAMSADQRPRIAARRSTRCAPALAGVSERAESA